MAALKVTITLEFSAGFESVLLYLCLSNSSPVNVSCHLAFSPILDKTHVFFIIHPTFYQVSTVRYWTQVDRVPSSDRWTDRFPPPPCFAEGEILCVWRVLQQPRESPAPPDGAKQDPQHQDLPSGTSFPSPVILFLPFDLHFFHPVRTFPACCVLLHLFLPPRRPPFPCQRFNKGQKLWGFLPPAAGCSRQPRPL